MGDLWNSNLGRYENLEERILRYAKEQGASKKEISRLEKQKDAHNRSVNRYLDSLRPWSDGNGDTR
jgi:hypothetical protein